MTQQDETRTPSMAEEQRDAVLGQDGGGFTVTNKRDRATGNPEQDAQAAAAVEHDRATGARPATAAAPDAPHSGTADDASDAAATYDSAIFLGMRNGEIFFLDAYQMQGGVFDVTVRKPMEPEQSRTPQLDLLENIMLVVDKAHRVYGADYTALKTAFTTLDMISQANRQAHEQDAVRRAQEKMRR